MKIRFAKLKDKNRVLKLLDELGESCNLIKGYNPANVEALKRGGPMFDLVLKDNNYHIILAEVKNKIVGLVSIYLFPNIRHGSFRGYVEDVIVDPNYQRKGIGTKLFDYIKNFLKEKNIDNFKLNTDYRNIIAQNFYLKNGGEQTELMYRFDL